MTNKRNTLWPIYTIIILLNLAPGFCRCQQANYVSGKVTDGANGKPVAGCSVYFSNTSKGDITSASGEFVLKNLPAGKYEMIISAIGYDTEVIPVSGSDYPHDMPVSLRTRPTQLSEVILHPYLKNGWKDWGQVFLENFVGTTPNAGRCRLVNHEAIQFRFSDKNNRLTASADEALVIENEALGYLIKYKLEEFTLDFNSQLLVYNGYRYSRRWPEQMIKKEINGRKIVPLLITAPCFIL